MLNYLLLEALEIVESGAMKRDKDSSRVGFVCNLVVRRAVVEFVVNSALHIEIKINFL